MERLFERLGATRGDQPDLEQRWGGKGASLDALLRAGLPVPPGFVVETGLFRAAVLDPPTAALLRQLAADLDGEVPPAPDTLFLRHPELGAAAAVLEARLRASLAAWPGGAPERLAVRSSAAGEDGEHHSFAGVLESFLAVRRDRIAGAVLLCWAAAFTSRFAAYCERHELDPADAAVAVVVQELVPAAASGVLLTHDPVSGSPQTVINAVRGFGSSLVDGEVEPDQYRSRPGGGWEVHRGEQAWETVLAVEGLVRRPLPAGGRNAEVLTSRERAGLLRLGRRVERLAGRPQDLEWAIRDGRLWLLQARPITSLVGERRVWTRANMKEIMPELPSPMTASLIETYKRNWAIEVLARRGFPVRRLAPAIRILKGRPYLNQTLMEQVAAAAGCDSAVIRRGLGGAAREEGSGRRGPDWSAVARNLAPLARLFRAYLALPGSARKVLEVARAGAERLEGLALEGMTDRELADEAVAAFRSLEPLEGLAGDLIGAINAWGLAAHALLRGRCASPDAFLASVTVASDASPTAQQVRDFERLIHLARAEPETVAALLRDSSGASDEDTQFAGEFARFLDRWGKRAVHETDSAVRRFEEEPAALLQSIRAAASPGLHDGPAERAARQRRSVEEAWASVETSLPGWERRLPLRLALLRGAAGKLRQLYAVREEVRFALSRVVAGQRRLELELGRRWRAAGWLEAPEDYFWLRVEEVRQAVSDDAPAGGAWMRERVRRRRERYAAWGREPMPNEWHEGWTPEMRASLESVPADRLPVASLERGLALSPGVVEGEVIVLRSPEELARVRPDSILVTPVIGPNWTAVFSVARGLVVEMSGVLSHGAILAREFGLPAVAGVPGATDLFRDGERVRVDGTTGTVLRLDFTQQPPAPARPGTQDQGLGPPLRCDQGLGTPVRAAGGG